MAEIKSTMDLVMARAASMGTASREELAAEEKVNRGMKLAAAYLQGEEEDLQAGLADKSATDRILYQKGMVRALLRNVVLPRDENPLIAERALQGLMEIGRGKRDLVPVAGEIKNILKRYIEHRQELREQLESALREQLEQAVARQTGQGAAGLRVDPSMHPKFQEEWQRLEDELNSQYGSVLEQHKDHIFQHVTDFLDP